MNYRLELVLAAALALTSCQLDFEPTDAVSGDAIFATDQGAQTAIDGCYAAMWRSSFVTSNTAHAVGHQSSLLAEELMGDDMVQMAYNWFGPDYALDYTAVISIGSGSRSYNLWNMYYTLISNVNYIIAQEGRIGSNGNEAKSITAQAYALRAFSYFELVQTFQKTYLGNEGAPGVPIYTAPTLAGDAGHPRGTVADVYAIINSDLAHAVGLFADIGKPRHSHCSHIDYYVARGLQARVALVQGSWEEARSAAADARSCLGTKVLSPSDIMAGFSSYSLPSTLWAMEVIPDQSSVYASIYCFLDATLSSAYGYDQRKCISRWLYDRIARYADARRDWFYDGTQGSATTGDRVNYGQKKLMSREPANWVGDLIYMRGEEMLLVEAEAEARLNMPDSAKARLVELAERRIAAADQPKYRTYLDGLNTAPLPLPALTNSDPKTVLEEVLLQRRIELWGEQGRIKDILRLKQGYTRTYDGSNHVEKLVGINTGAESGAFLFKIPQAEFDGNKSIVPGEQNPTK